jgi:hypothetical protein
VKRMPWMRRAKTVIDRWQYAARFIRNLIDRVLSRRTATATSPSSAATPGAASSAGPTATRRAIPATALKGHSAFLFTASDRFI